MLGLDRLDEALDAYRAGLETAIEFETQEALEAVQELDLGAAATPILDLLSANLSPDEPLADTGE